MYSGVATVYVCVDMHMSGCGTARTLVRAVCRNEVCRLTDECVYDVADFECNR